MVTDGIRRVLFISYTFPPIASVGSLRPTKFVKYLPEFGWHPTVLTVANPSAPLVDGALCDEIPPGVPVIRARTLEPGYGLKRAVARGSGMADRSGDGTADEGTRSRRGSRLLRLPAVLVKELANTLLVPDAQVLWNPAAYRAARRALAERPHDAVFVSAPPFSSLVLGARISRAYGLPLVVDYRDEWDISNRYWENKSRSRYVGARHRRLEDRVLRTARAVVATTRRSVATLATRARALGNEPLSRCIYNGWDAADFPAAPTLETFGERYRLTYTGSLWRLTSPEPLVRALCRLSKTAPELAEHIDLVVAGRILPRERALLMQLASTPVNVHELGHVSHGDAVRLMLQANALCVTLADVAGAERVVPSKIFEYMAARRRIFCVAPRGEVQEIADACPLAVTHAPNEIEAICGSLAEDVRRFLTRRRLEIGDWTPRRFERRTLTGELAELLDAVAVTPAVTRDVAAAVTE
ncbi:MAG: hypothetical protein D6725_00835 [Planctomycetota bacterium]|nr:MAG: hypothetical protein D6725_00835 [Planctomycetota bacterium]